MSNVIATASIENDVNFTLIKTGSNQISESSSLNYSQSLTNGSATLNVNYGVLASGVLPSGGKEYLDLRALSKENFDTTSSIQFSKVRGIVINNKETVYGWDINVHATGGTALSEIFNGNTGALLIKPRAVHQYSDPISGLIVDGTNRQITLEDVCGSGAKWRLVVVGITG